MILNIETVDSPEMIEYIDVTRYLYRDDVLWIFRECDPRVVTFAAGRVHRTEESKIGLS